MKFTYLGTAAAEGIPGLFCNCEVCKKSKAAGGKNIRTRSQALINDDLMIDFGPDTYLHVLRNGVDLSKLHTLLITHAHDDHLTADEVHYRNFGMAYINGGTDDSFDTAPPLHTYITPASAQYLYGHQCEESAIAIHEILFFQTYQSGEYTFIPLRAEHAPGFDAAFYAISDGEKHLLYAHDTGIFPEDTMDYLKESGIVFDFISLDCTLMIDQSGPRHMCLEHDAIMRDRLLEIGVANEKTIFCCNHFSHNGHCTHDEFVPLAAEKGFLVAYDGMEVEL